MSHMGRLVCTADPPPCLADSMAPPASLTGALSLALVTSASPERRRNSPHRDALKAHRAFVRETLALPRVRWVRTLDDLISRPVGGLGVLFGAQYAPYGMTEAAVGEWRAARLQSMAPFSGGSEYGGGAEWRDSGLTERGRLLIKWMSEYGIVLDLSNAGHRTAREALAFIRQENLSTRVMASHSGCYEIYQHSKNLPDDVLSEIADLGGYVGIPALASVLVESSGDLFRALARHLSHAGRVCGSDAVGIGSSISVDFRVLERRLNHFFSQSAVEGYLGRNFESFLFHFLP